LRHKNVISTAHFSPDGKQLVTASGDSTAKLWDAQTGLPIATFEGGRNSVRSAEFSRDGSRLILAGFDAHARIWRLEPRQQLADMSHETVIEHAAFSPDGSRVVTGSRDRTARVWRADTGEPACPPMLHDAYVATTQFSADGRCILTTCFDNTARVWDAASGQLLVQPLKHGGRVNHAEFSPNGDLVVTASDDQSTQIWSVTVPDRSPKALPHTHAVWAEFSPDGSRILTWSYDGTARVWDAHTGDAVTPRLKHSDMIRRACFSWDSTRVITASRDKTARVWDARTGQPLVQVQHGSTVVDADFSLDGAFVATASADRTARVWNARTGEPQSSPLRHRDTVYSVRFSPDGRRIATASSDGTARVWDAATGRPLFAAIQHSAAVRTARFSPDGGRLVTASADMTARVWDAETGRPLSPPLRHFGEVNWAEFSPDGRLVLTASFDGTARLWDATTGQPLGAPFRHGGEVWVARFSPDGRRIATGAYDKTARVWDTLSAQPITEPLRHVANVVSVSFSPDGHWLVTGQELRGRIAEEQPGKHALIWEIPQTPLPIPSLLVELAEAVAGLRVSEEGLLEIVSPTRFLQLNSQLAGEHTTGDPAQQPASPDAARIDYYQRFVHSYLAPHAVRTPPTSSSTPVPLELSSPPEVWAQRTSASAVRIPARDPLCSSNCVDLTAYFTAGLTEDWHTPPTVPGWNLSRLTPGPHVFAGVEFDVRGVIQLAGGKITNDFPEYPREVRGVSVQRHCCALHFLHASVWAYKLSPGTRIGAYLVEYADGQKEEIPIVHAEDMLEWQVINDPVEALKHATVAWTGRTPHNRPVRLFKRTWENPRPDVMITSFDFRSTVTDAGPFLIAVTIEP
jgi:WD40 repeat protein